ncbi:MAG: hypothetical protein JST22_01555 [Bacteroidetes bacterium]|nr:hypothetical protein [Bacteroidota bacterium]
MASISADRLLEFLNALPDVLECNAAGGGSAAGFDQWIGTFRAALQPLLPDADRISAFVVYDAVAGDSPGAIHQLPAPDSRLALRSYRAQDQAGTEGMVASHTETDHEAPLEEFLDDLRRMGYPLHLHHPPAMVELRHAGVRVGGIMLWRDIGRPPLSANTLELMERMKPFLAFVFSNFIAHHRERHAHSQTVVAAAYRFFADANLTPQEQKIMWMRMIGRSYKEIGADLGIAVSTVKKHINTIHGKMGTGSINEVFAKFIAL